MESIIQKFRDLNIKTEAGELLWGECGLECGMAEDEIPCWDCYYKAEANITLEIATDILHSVSAAKASFKDVTHLCGGDPTSEDIFQLGYAAAVFRFSTSLRDRKKV